MSEQTFGAFVRSARYSQGIATKDLAKKIGITSAQIYNIEKGKSKPQPATFAKLVDALGLDRNEAAKLL